MYSNQENNIKINCAIIVHIIKKPIRSIEIIKKYLKHY